MVFRAEQSEHLLRQKPYLRLYFQNFQRPSEYSAAHFSLESSDKGMLSVSYRRASRYTSESILLTSRYQPHREAERLLRAAFPAENRANSGKKREVILLLGLGAPALLGQLLKILEPGQICIAVDAHLELGRLLYSHSADLQNFLLRPGCHLFCGREMRPLLRQYLESLPAEGFRGLRIVHHPASLRLAPQFYSEVESETGNLLKARLSDLLTRMKFEQLWLKNILLNCRYLPPADNPEAALYTVRGYENILKGRPGLLVAAGPSLTESLEYLSLLQERAFILAVDTALAPLLAANIRPHAVISLDAQPHSLFSFLGFDLSSILLFADLVAQPHLLRKTRPAKVVFSTTTKLVVSASGEANWEFTPGTQYAHTIHGPIGGLQSGGSVATSGFDLLRFLGCDPLILIGQDLAYSDRCIHANGTHHYIRWLTALSRCKSLPGIIENIVNRRKTFQTTAIDGKSILTDYVLNIYRQWFEDSFSRCQQSVVNLTARGAVLKNALRPKDSLQFIRSLPKMEKLPEPLTDCRPLHRFHHPQEEKLYHAVCKTIEGQQSSAQLVETFPFMQPIISQAELYIRRNAARLDSKKESDILREKSLEALKEIERVLSRG